jgi:hypothetical protein
VRRDRKGCVKVIANGIYYAEGKDLGVSMPRIIHKDILASDTEFNNKVTHPPLPVLRCI